MDITACKLWLLFLLALASYVITMRTDTGVLVSVVHVENISSCNGNARGAGTDTVNLCPGAQTANKWRGAYERGISPPRDECWRLSCWRECKILLFKADVSRKHKPSTVRGIWWSASEEQALWFPTQQLSLGSSIDFGKASMYMAQFTFRKTSWKQLLRHFPQDYALPGSSLLMTETMGGMKSKLFWPRWGSGSSHPPSGETDFSNYPAFWGSFRHIFLHPVLRSLTFSCSMCPLLKDKQPSPSANPSHFPSNVPLRETPDYTFCFSLVLLPFLTLGPAHYPSLPPAHTQQHCFLLFILGDRLEKNYTDPIQCEPKSWPDLRLLLCPKSTLQSGCWYFIFKEAGPSSSPNREILSRKQ